MNRKLRTSKTFCVFYAFKFLKTIKKCLWFCHAIYIAIFGKCFVILSYVFKVYYIISMLAKLFQSAWFYSIVFGIRKKRKKIQIPVNYKNCILKFELFESMY